MGYSKASSSDDASPPHILEVLRRWLALDEANLEERWPVFTCDEKTFAL